MFKFENNIVTKFLYIFDTIQFYRLFIVAQLFVGKKSI